MSTQPVRFLLVEDDDSHALLVTRNLERARVVNTVDRVSDGAQALAYLRAEAPYQQRVVPDVVLLDLKLPKIDGLEVLERIKNDEQLRKIPVVILTTSDAERDRAQAYNSHVNSYVVKPIDFEQFQNMIRDLGFYWAIWNCRPQ
jgi:CheY-like chemotaxis protein